MKLPLPWLSVTVAAEVVPSPQTILAVCVSSTPTSVNEPTKVTVLPTLMVVPWVTAVPWLLRIASEVSTGGWLATSMAAVAGVLWALSCRSPQR